MWFRGAVGGFLLPGLLAAQSVPVPVRGDIEVAGLGSFNAGSSLSSESAVAPGGSGSSQRVTSPPSNGGIGFQVAANISRHFVVTADWGYLAGGRSVYNQVYYLDQPSPITQSSSAVVRASSTRMGVGFQYYLPLRRHPRVIPYVGAGAGAARSSGDLSVSAVGGAPGESSSGPYTSYHGLETVSGGARYYFNERIGIRVEGQANQVAARGYFASIALGFFIRVR